MTTPVSCVHEADVLDLIAIGQWPRRAGVELIAHVAQCPICSDLATVASAIVDDRAGTTREVHVPDASLVWYRAQLQAREDATRRAAWPVLMAPLAAVAVALVTLLVWFPSVTQMAADSVQRALAWAAGLRALATGAVATLWPIDAELSSLSSWWPLAAFAGVAVLVPLALSIAGWADRTVASRPPNEASMRR